jgi:hypothetical protein
VTDTKDGLFARVRAWLELLSFVAVAGGIGLGFAGYLAGKAQDRRDVAEAVYDALDAEYRAYLTTLAQYPRLAGRHRPAGVPAPDLTPDERTQERLLQGLLIDLFERAYLEYNDPAKVALMGDERRAQWAGWQQDIDRTFASPSVRVLWHEIGPEFDARFQSYVNSRIGPG